MALDRSMDQSPQSSLSEEPCSADPLLRADSSSLTNEVDVQTPSPNSFTSTFLLSSTQEPNQLKVIDLIHQRNKAHRTWRYAKQTGWAKLTRVSMFWFFSVSLHQKQIGACFLTGTTHVTGSGTSRHTGCFPIAPFRLIGLKRIQTIKHWWK